MIILTLTKVALSWIKCQDKKWKHAQFMEHCVIEIKQLVPAECWRHCPGEINSADLPSRGAELFKLLSNPLAVVEVY